MVKIAGMPLTLVAFAGLTVSAATRPTPDYLKKADEGVLAKNFITPPHEAKPQTWYHLMNGNVTKEGITADFEALAKIGIGGVQMFDAGCDIPAGPIAFNSPAWFDMLEHAAREARRLGLEICIPNCSGWSSSGGPWNMPSNGMKVVTWRETAAKGPSKFLAKLARDTDDNGFYEDIAVLAFPTPKVEKVSYPGVKTEIKGTTFTLSSDHPFTACGMSFRLKFNGIWGADATVKVEVSDDGAAFRTMESFVEPLARSGECDESLRFHPFPQPITVRAIRANFCQAPAGMKIAEARPEARMSISNLKAKTFGVRLEAPRDVSVAAPDQIVHGSDVRVLTESLAKDGTLDWDVPAGDWTIIRIGYKCNGRRNHPASKHGVGLEVDKLSFAAMDYHFNQYVGGLCKKLGPLAGKVKTGLNNILVDSYEVGSQNWTQTLDETFKKRRGYSLVPYLPVFTGRIVDSVDVSERFLEDFRRVVADLFAENYAGALQKKCHDFGLQLSLEPYGSCPADNLQYGKYVDIPMGEFWSNAGIGDFELGEGNVRFPTYIAHVWGRRFAATESFTAEPGSGGRWCTTPFSIKAQCDRVYTRGVNRIIYHRFTHQPWVKPCYLPGMTMGRWGMHFDRTQTWWDFSSGWIAYQSRCQAMLQAGTFVADALFFCGEQAPNQGGNTEGGAKVDMSLPRGYAWDICSTDALMKLRVEGGCVVVPGGVRYAMLVLPPLDTMSASVLAKIGELVAAGAKVCGVQRPTRAPGLVGYPESDGVVVAKASRIWAKGVMECPPAEALKRLGLSPDFQAFGVPMDGKGATYIHRRQGKDDWYFVAIPNRKPVTFEASFRTTGRVPEIWDAMTGRIADAGVWRVENDRTVVQLGFDVSGSAFVVFRRPITGDHIIDIKAEVRQFPNEAEGGKIEIVKAEYGAFALGKIADFTERLRRQEGNGVIDVVVDNALAGNDPAYLVPKKARIVYRVNGKDHCITLAEHARLVLPEGAADKQALAPYVVEVKGKGVTTVWAAKPIVAELTFASGVKKRIGADVPAPQVIEGPWQVYFPHDYVPNTLAEGVDEVVTFETLLDWAEHPSEGVRYFSGTATYAKTIVLDEAIVEKLARGGRLLLDLGNVKHFAEISVNGKAYPAIWKPPFRVDITDSVSKTHRPISLRIRVANLWPNRLIGDDRLCAPDCEWGGFRTAAGVKEIGIKKIPQWVKDGKKSPTGRVTFTTWKHWDKDDDLQPSGLIGPVRFFCVVPAERL